MHRLRVISEDIHCVHLLSVAIKDILLRVESQVASPGTVRHSAGFFRNQLMMIVINFKNADQITALISDQNKSFCRSIETIR